MRQRAHRGKLPAMTRRSWTAQCGKVTLALFLLLSAAVAPGADSTRTAPAESAQASTASSRISVLTGDQVVQILDETVDWYRTLGTQQQTATQPSDLLLLYANRQTADQIMKLAFDFARANAELLSL